MAVTGFWPVFKNLKATLDYADNPDKTTAGCTAMDEAAMQALVGWLKPDDHPAFVLMPDAAYDARQAAWQLPARTSFR